MRLKDAIESVAFDAEHELPDGTIANSPCVTVKDAIRLSIAAQFVVRDQVMVGRSKTVHEITDLYRLHGLVYAEVWNSGNRRTREVTVSQLRLADHA